MAADAAESLWQKFFDQHKSIVSLLDTHASLLAEMCQSCADISPAQELVQARLAHTESLIATFKESTESVREATKREEIIFEATSSPPHNVPPPRPHVPATPALDPSGLFTVDTNPTPIEQLFRDNSKSGDKSKNQSKRKGDEPQVQLSYVNGASHDSPKKKKKKLKPSDQGPEQDSGADDSFLRGVEARLQAKEERKKAKQDKKRKRQSDSSISNGVKGPKNKKRKQRHDNKASSKTLEIRQNQSSKRPNAESTGTGTQNDQPSKKQKKNKT
ncbi:uncharacterized protein Z518_05132 [Rhinocladiella mackenziei CBS 650.93]|uniref:Uncharacterized protein n=1 Tax=Rhinocladiella mackenziei CBS 650.93 TaxID=1442369 RepID=A0A0D2ITN0_9EURO|nr:uncharacterized protein Z518_11003 [Rhinocladiella mackenziei CBS 650.93]XP_013271401.1 uncharacterized protein Z518_05132 [Rhinocladiella mackenziei CBS 650.93]KIX00075.1 hypothetical protein Z518_11003 [Rhinocladiella mackenziei CBS 650.93]KIX04265.1 hypothetical protein Z518_05132 [Rhinocladiella mackenziei CBS 650.93]